MAVIGVVVVDVHVAFTDAFAALLSTSADLRVVGAAFDTASAVAAVRRLHPDVATVDLDLAGTDGVDVVAAVHALAPDLAITIVTGVKNPQRAITAIWSGATSWVAKEDSTTTLFDVLRRAAAGESSFPPALLGADPAHPRGQWRFAKLAHRGSLDTLATRVRRLALPCRGTGPQSNC